MQQIRTFFIKKYIFFSKKFALNMRAVALHLTNSCTFGRRLLENSYLATLERICQHSPEATFVKCCKYAPFLSKNTFFS